MTKRAVPREPIRALGNTPFLSQGAGNADEAILIKVAGGLPHSTKFLPSQVSDSHASANASRFPTNIKRPFLPNLGIYYNKTVTILSSPVIIYRYFSAIICGY